MNDGAILAGGVLLGVAAVGIALRRRQDRSILDDWGARHGWAIETWKRQEMLRRLGGLSLLQTGHSRRIISWIEDGNGVALFEYTSETGVEHYRELHRFIGTIVPVAHSRGRAVFSTDEWVLSATAAPWLRRIEWGQVADENTGPLRVGLVEDEANWAKVSTADWLNRMTKEPPGRTWELLGDYLVGFEAAPFTEAHVASLASAGKELAKLLY